MQLVGKNEKPRLTETLGGEVKQGWDSTERLSERLETFANYKHSTKQFIDWGLDGGIPLFDKFTTKIFRALNSCGEYLIFRNFLVSKRSRLVGACSCKQHLLCAFCASRRGVKYSMAYKEKVEFLKDQANDNLDLVFLTFTVKNGLDLVERFRHLQGAMRALLKRRNNQFNRLERAKHQTEMAKLIGGVFAYEIKQGSGGEGWHPHIHMLALLPKHLKIDIQALKDEWLDITGDSKVINIEYTSNDTAYLEVFAYALKFSEMEHSDRWHAFQILRGERLISSFGDLRGIEVDEDVTDDILITDEPFVDLIFKWHTHRGYSEHARLTPNIAIKAA